MPKLTLLAVLPGQAAFVLVLFVVLSACKLLSCKLFSFVFVFFFCHAQDPGPPNLCQAQSLSGSLWLKLSRSNTRCPSDSKLVIMCVVAVSSSSFVIHSSMASKAMCHGEADLEPKLRKAGSPPWSFGLGNTQLACLFLLLSCCCCCCCCCPGLLLVKPSLGF